MNVLRRKLTPAAVLRARGKEAARAPLLADVHLGRDISNAEALCLSLDPAPKLIDGVPCLPWERGLAELGL